MSDLADALDTLADAHNLTEAAYMAASVLQSDQRGPMCALLYVVSEKIVDAKAALERIHALERGEDAGVAER